jgi:hypothetical protein
MNFDDTPRLSTPRLPLPPALRNYLIRRFGALPINWWELLTPKGLEYVKQYSGEATPVATPNAAKLRCANVFEDDNTRCRRLRRPGKRFCERCATLRARARHAKYNRKRRSNDDKIENSPVRTEALTKPENEVRYNDP